MDLGLKGKVALVTGAGSQKGYGRGIALALAKEGCSVIVADLDLHGAEQTASEIDSERKRALALRADVTKTDEVVEIVNQGIARFGRIDILVNNAGAIGQLKDFVDKTEAECDADINLNLKGAMNCTRAVLPQMISRGSGRIINISSIGAGKGMAHTSAYGAAKAGLIGFTKCIAVELAPKGVNVNCVSPGLGLTNFGGGGPPPELLKSAVARIPARRTTTPEDIGNVVAFLASVVSSDIVGQAIAVDGGESIA